MPALCVLALVIGCGGDPRAERGPEPTQIEPIGDEPALSAERARVDAPPSATASRSGTPSAAPSASAAASAAPTSDTEPDFDAPMPSEPCPEGARVRASHRTHRLPALLVHALALRAAGGQRIRIAIADAPITQDAQGRFLLPTEGGARFEMDATRTRRGPLDARVLGPPDAARGGLTNARVVTAEASLTFGHRALGQVELTHVDETQICGRIDLNDGFIRIRGGFSAPVIGPLPP